MGFNVFNNGGGRPDGTAYSEVIELVPPLGDGTYPIPESGPWGPTPRAGRTPPQRSSRFLPRSSQAASGSGAATPSSAPGRFQEVTPDGRIVWDYLNPYEGDLKNADGSDPQPLLLTRSARSSAPPSSPLTIPACGAGSEVDRVRGPEVT